MTKIVTSLLSLSLACSAALAADAAISAVKVTDSLDAVKANSAVWSKAKFSSVTLYPQTSIEMNDKNANAITDTLKAKKAQVGALYDGKNIALMVKWADGSKDVQAGYASTTYSDGFAVQLAGTTAKPQPLPYIGMGSAGRPVVVHLQKANEKVYEPNGNMDVSTQINRNQTALFGKELKEYDAKVASLATTNYARTFVGEGFRSLTEVKDGSAKSTSGMVYANGGWSGTLVRPLQDAYVNLSGTVPLAIAVWDGSKMGRNGVKNFRRGLRSILRGKNPMKHY